MKQPEDAILYCPDGFSHASIPYLSAYVQCRATKDFGELLKPSHRVVLFSWSFLWQSIDWVDRLDKQVIIGGSAARYLAHKHQLETKPNVRYWLEDIDLPEYQETRIIPDFSLPLAENPLTDCLKVYSGSGCNWGKCTFCTWIGGPHKQFDPAYVAAIILHANSFGKLAGLSAPSHTVEWLVEVEKFPPPGKRYWCYLNAHDHDYRLVKKAHEIFIGSEYLADSVLARIKKGVKAQQVMDAILEILSAGINVYSTIIEDLYQNEDELQEHTRNKLWLLTHTAPPRLGWGKLWLGSCRLIDPNHYDCMVPKTDSGSLVEVGLKGEG